MADEIIRLVYIGPTIQGERLSKGKIITGTQGEIDKYISGMAARYPHIRYMMVRPENLSRAQYESRTPGNVRYKYYREIVSAARAAHKRSRPAAYGRKRK